MRYAKESPLKIFQEMNFQNKSMSHLPASDKPLSLMDVLCQRSETQAQPARPSISFMNFTQGPCERKICLSSTTLRTDPAMNSRLPTRQRLMRPRLEHLLTLDENTSGEHLAKAAGASSTVRQIPLSRLASSGMLMGTRKPSNSTAALKTTFYGSVRASGLVQRKR